MVPEGDTGTGAGEQAEQGGGKQSGKQSASPPPRAFVNGRWMTTEELAAAAQAAEEEKAELRGRLAAMEQQAAQRQASGPAAPALPEWATDALDKGVPEGVVRALLQAQAGGASSGGSGPDVREVVRDELTSITKQARQAMGAAEKARLEYARDNPDFDETEMQRILGSDPVVKDGYDDFHSRGKFYQAIDYAWKSRLSEGRPVNRRGRSAADMPPGRRLVADREGRLGDEGEMTESGARRPKIDQAVIEAAQIGGEDAVRAYMRQRRKGTALDLDTEPPSGWRGR